MANRGKPLLSAGALLFFTCAAPLARAAIVAPADPCSVLSAAAVTKTMGQTYGSPQKKVAPRPFANSVEGTYQPSGDTGTLLYRVYFDHSAAEATDLFARLNTFFGRWLR